MNIIGALFFEGYCIRADHFRVKKKKESLYFKQATFDQALLTLTGEIQKWKDIERGKTKQKIRIKDQSISKLECIIILNKYNNLLIT